MDRPIVYVGSIPRAEDFFALAQNTGIAVGALGKAVFGTSPVIDGLGLTALGTLAFQVNPGSITQYGALEATPYGLLPADTTDSLLKMGINVAPITVAALTAPSTAGQSINYLVEVTMVETDLGPLVLPYYNAANPGVPFSGPANSGTAQNTTRTQRVAVQVKPGAAAATGSQVTPAADSGWTALAVITVNYGQTALTQTQLNAAVLASAPIIGSPLQAMTNVLAAAGMAPAINSPGSFLVALQALFELQLGYTPVQQGTGIGQQANVVKIGWSSSNKPKLTIDNTDEGNIALENWVNGGFVPGIMKVGLASAAPSGTTVQNGLVTFPTPFPTTCYMAHAIPVVAANSGTGYYPTTAMPSFSQTGATFKFDTLTGVGSSTAVDFNQTFYFYWWAWGG